jgi:hypothetical protein
LRSGGIGSSRTKVRKRKRPFVSLEISGVSGSAKLPQKHSFLERTQTASIYASTNPVPKLSGC